MSQGQLERIGPDAILAFNYLSQARSFLRDGAVEILSAEGRSVLLHAAAIAACDAVLATRGWEVEGSEGGHKLRLAKAGELLPSSLEELFERLDENRMTRHERSYLAGAVAPSEVDDVLADVRVLMAAAEEAVLPSVPPWLAGPAD